MGEPTREPAWIMAIFGNGPWWCSSCRCELTHPGICDPCAERYERRQEDTHLTTCMESIPPRFRWAAFSSEILATRVSRVEDGRECARRLMTGSHMLVLSGGAGKGKTSLACAILREIAGARSPVSWRCRFVEAKELGVSRRDASLGETPESVRIGKGASVLVLDDLGQETSTEPITEVLHYRHNRRAPTIVTTFLGERQLLARYDGGTERRLTDGALWIDMGGAQ